MHLFLQLVQQRSPRVEVKVIITDDGKPMLQICNNVMNIPTDNTGWNSAQQVYGQETKHLLCLWHNLC